MTKTIEYRILVTTDSEDAGDRIEATIRRALGLWLDPTRIEVERAQHHGGYAIKPPTGLTGYRSRG